MRDLARPAFEKWIVEDYGIDQSLLKAFWGEVDKMSSQIDARNAEYYLK